jgi:hypothetical protein
MIRVISMLQIGLEILLVILLLFEAVSKIRAYYSKISKQKQITISKNSDNAGQHTVESMASHAELSNVDNGNEIKHNTEPYEELKSIDLLNEANIYIEYKMYDQAIIVLKWYVDIHKSDFIVISKLLDIYLSIGDIDDYVKTLNSIPIKTRGQIHAEEWRIDAIKNGLKHELDNPELLALAKEYNINPNILNDENEHIDAEKALKLASQSNNYNYQSYILKKAIKNEPRKLSLHAEILRLAYKNKKYDDYLDGLILLFLILGEANTTIQKRMLSVAKQMNLGQDFDTVAGWNGDTSKLKKIAIKRNIKLPACV